MVPIARPLPAVLLSLSLLVACGPGESGPDGGDGGLRDAGSDGGGDGGGDGGSSDGGDAGTDPASIELVSFSATAQGPTEVALSWLPGPGAVTGFELARASSEAGPFTQLVILDSNESRHVDQGLTTNTTYWYRARALSDSGPSDWSAVAWATPSQAANTAPAPPQDLAIAPYSDTALVLTWTLPDALVTVEVERAAAPSGPFFKIFSSAAGAVQFQDTSLLASTAYWYRLRAVKAGLASDPTGAVQGTTLQVPAPPTPTGLAAVVANAGGASTVRLTWADVAGETGYQVEWSTDGASWTSKGALPADATAWTDLTPQVLTGNQYRLRAVNAGGASPWAPISIYVSGITVTYLCFPPTAVGITAVSETVIRLNWTYNSIAHCSRVAVERASVSGGPYVEVGQASLGFFYPPPPLDSGLFEDTGRTPGTQYFYRLRSVGLSQDWTSAGYSAEVSAQTPNLLTPPTGLTATVVSSTQAEFSWSDPSSEETGFAVEWASAAAGPFTELVRVSANVTTANAQGLQPGTPYWVRLRTVKGAAVSAPSAAVGFTTATVLVLRVNADTTVFDSSSLQVSETQTFPNIANQVGCRFTKFFDSAGAAYMFHHCGGAALRFDTSALSGRTVLAASLRMTPGNLAAGPLDSVAQYAVFALASAWNPATVTYRTLPGRRTEGAWGIPPPTGAAYSFFNVTEIARNWANGTWGHHGLFVQQYPIVDRFPPNGALEQEQTTLYCSLEQQCGNADYVPTLFVEYF